jgi:hypothetical protein
VSEDGTHSIYSFDAQKGGEGKLDSSNKFAK